MGLTCRKNLVFVGSWSGLPLPYSYPVYTSTSDFSQYNYHYLHIEGYGNVLLSNSSTSSSHGIAVNIGGTTYFACCEYPQVQIYSCATSCITGIFYTCVKNYIQVRIDSPMMNFISLACMSLCIDYGAGACAECVSNWTTICSGFQSSICFTRTCCAGIGCNGRFVRLRYGTSGGKQIMYCYTVPYCNSVGSTCTAYIRSCSCLEDWY